jgi:MFS family permease
VERLFTKAFIVLTGAHFFASLGYASMLLLPLYLVHLGGSRAEIGAIMAAASLGGLVSRPAVGWCLDAFGRRPTLVVGTLLASLGLVSIGFITTTGPMVYLVRIVFGMGGGALFTGYFAFASDIVPVSRRTEGIAIFGVAGLGALVVNPTSTLLGVEAGDIRLFLPVVGALVFASLVLLLQVEERAPTSSRANLTVAAVISSLKAHPLRSVWFADIVFSGCVGIFMTFATVSAEKAGVQFPTALWFTYAGGAAVVRLAGGRIPDRVGPARIVAPALATYVLAFWVVAESTTSPGFLAAGLLGGIGHGYCFPVLTSLVVTRVSDEHRGIGLAMFTAIWGVSSLVFNPLFGALADATSDRIMFLTAAVIAIIAVGQWVILERKFGGGA